MRRIALAWPLRTLTVTACLLLGSVPAHGDLKRVEREFENAIQKVTPATVVCLPHGVDPRYVPGGFGSSGVILTRDGLILSDGDVGFHLVPPPGEKQIRKNQVRTAWKDVIEVRVPVLRKGKTGFNSYTARVIRRSRLDPETRRGLDTALLKIDKPPSGGFRYLRIGNSDRLKVGDFAFVMGNSFGMAGEVPPTLTAGVVASLVPKGSGPGGRYRYIYTSAAVNPGVNGGPLVDVEGQLIGTISNAVEVANEPQSPYQFLGKVIPIERLKAFYKDEPRARDMFVQGPEKTARSKQAAVLETVFHHTGVRAYRSVVSIEVRRKKPLSLAVPGSGGTFNMPRYLGPVSGILVSREGHVLTSLYNLANIGSLGEPIWRRGMQPVPENSKIKTGLAGIEAIGVHLPDGNSVPAKLLTHHEGLGLAMLKADLGKARTYALETLPAAPPETYTAGRFVLAVGNPFGAERLPEPLLTVGVLSKQHAGDIEDPWAAQWQTDAGITDANCGGAAVDLEGRLIGMLTIWSPAQHGRNSGIGFICPWTRIEPILPALMAGKRPPFMGIRWTQHVSGRLTTVIDRVYAGSPAAKGGMKKGDVIVRIEETQVDTPADVREILDTKWSGDELQVTVERDGKELQLKLVLGARPG